MRLKLLIVALLLSAPAFAHDKKHPDLNEWYTSLKSPGSGISCCNIQDCHPTEAEMRGDDWWARAGVRNGESGEWTLLKYVKVPKEKVLKNTDNPTGGPVICHTMAWVGTEFAYESISIYCFIVPNLY